MNTDLKHRVNAGKVAVEEQVDFFRTQFGQVASEWKEDATRVTFADFAISEKIIAALQRSFPEDDFCSEESSHANTLQPLTAKFAWVLDPIDGTNNFALGLPMCAISLGLLEHGQPVYGFVYEYARDMLIHGGAGQGLFQNSKRISLSERPLSTRESLLAMQFPLPAELLESYMPLLRAYRARSIGSGTLSLTYTALGKFDGVYDHKCKVWDIAAAAALAQEAGRPLHFLEQSPFPLTHFSTQLSTNPYYAGSPAFCDYMKETLG